MVAIVDDDESVRSALQGFMKEVGFPARAFACAEEFLKSDEQQHTACLIADIRLPGMSGLELQAQLNGDHNRIPILFITAHGDEQLRFRPHWIDRFCVLLHGRKQPGNALLIKLTVFDELRQLEPMQPGIIKNP